MLAIKHFHNPSQEGIGCLILVIITRTLCYLRSSVLDNSDARQLKSYVERNETIVMLSEMLIQNIIS